MSNHTIIWQYCDKGTIFLNRLLGPREFALKEYIFVVGPFSSGTTAVAGLLMRLGAVGLSPFLSTNDPRTPTSLESLAFRQLCDSLISEDTFEFQRNGREKCVPMLLGFRDHLDELRERGERRPFVLKRATSAFILREIDLVFQPSFVFVYRDLQGIENTKVRRRWSESHGEWGANLIYEEMRKFSGEKVVEEVEFSELRQCPRAISERLSRNLGLNPTEEMLTAASRWITNHSTGIVLERPSHGTEGP